MEDRSNAQRPTPDAVRAEAPDARRAEAPDARRIPAIVNTDAGTAEEVLAAIEASGRFELFRCAGGEVGAATRRAVDAGHPRILVAGGDGTVGAAAAEVVGRDVELAIVPGGTLNHFARDHGIPADDLEAAIALALTGQAQPTDVARVNERLFLNTSSVGAYVSLVRIRDTLEPRLGYRLASLVAAVRVYFTMHRFAVEITGPAGPRVFRTPLLFIGVGERELKLPALGGRVADGRAGLHVMVVQGRTRGAVLALAFAAAFKGIEGMRTPHLETAILDRCLVTLRNATGVAADGEIVRLPSPLRYELLPGALRLVRP